MDNINTKPITKGFGIINYRNLRNISFAAIAALLLALAGAAESSGQYTIEQSVIAGGGMTNAVGGQFAVSGTLGQSVAGQTAANPPASAHAGFWNPIQFAPTAATVSILGKVTTADGRGIRNVLLYLTSDDGLKKSAQTSSFGYFRFDDIAVGQVYVLEITSKRFSFANSSRLLSVKDEIPEIIFIAEP